MRHESELHVVYLEYTEFLNAKFATSGWSPRAPQNMRGVWMASALAAAVAATGVADPSQITRACPHTMITVDDVELSPYKTLLKSLFGDVDTSPSDGVLQPLELLAAVEHLAAMYLEQEQAVNLKLLVPQALELVSGNVILLVTLALLVVFTALLVLRVVTARREVCSSVRPSPHRPRPHSTVAMLQVADAKRHVARLVEQNTHKLRAISGLVAKNKFKMLINAARCAAAVKEVKKEANVANSSLAHRLAVQHTELSSEITRLADINEFLRCSIISQLAPTTASNSSRPSCPSSRPASRSSLEDGSAWSPTARTRPVVGKAASVRPPHPPWHWAGLPC